MTQFWCGHKEFRTGTIDFRRAERQYYKAISRQTHCNDPSSNDIQSWCCKSIVTTWAINAAATPIFTIAALIIYHGRLCNIVVFKKFKRPCSSIRNTWGHFHDVKIYQYLILQIIYINEIRAEKHTGTAKETYSIEFNAQFTYRKWRNQPGDYEPYSEYHGGTGNRIWDNKKTQRHNSKAVANQNSDENFINPREHFELYPKIDMIFTGLRYFDTWCGADRYGSRSCHNRSGVRKIFLHVVTV